MVPIRIAQVAYMMAHPGVRRPGLNVILKKYCNGRHNEHKDDVVHYDGLWEKRPIKEQNLRYAAADVEHLCEAALAMMKNKAMRRELVLHRTETTVLRVQLQQVVRGPHNAPAACTSAYAKLSRKDRMQQAAKAFYEYMLANPDLRRRCQDHTLCRMEYVKWKNATAMPNNPPGTKYQGAFSDVVRHLMNRRLIIKRGVGGDASTIVWTVDIEEGSTGAEARRAASEEVRVNRAFIESDKSDVRVGPVVGLPESAPVGKEVRCTVRIENAGSTSLVLSAARFLQAMVSRAVKPVFAASVPGHSFPLHFRPHTFANVEIVCMPTFGISRDLLELDFGTFSVGRFLELSGGDAALHDALKPTAPFKKVKRQRGPLKAQAVLSEGVKPSSGAPPWQRDTGYHVIPRALADQLWSGELEETLEPMRERMIDDPKGLPRDLATDYPR